MADVKSDSEFGHWTTLEERLEELRDRLVAWQMTSPQGADGIWKEAKALYEECIEGEVNPYGLRGKAIVECFENALFSHDVIWLTSQTLAQELGLDDEDEMP